MRVRQGQFVCGKSGSHVSFSSALTSETPRGGNIYCWQRGADISGRIHFKTELGASLLPRLEADEVPQPA